ncbi:MAG TPA: hypothetical protein VGM80_13450 [Gaiellaceae bacterium]|jgi:hypothetical protein
MPRKIGLAALTAVLSLALTMAALADSKKKDAASSATTTQTTSINNGGNTPNCGNSCDQSHNPTDYEKPCAAVPGNGCHTLPDTPCERGHGGTEIGNKHCASTPALTILKEQSSSSTSGFTHDVLDARLSRDLFYRVTVTNLSSTEYTLVASDPLCDDPVAHPLVPTGPQTLPALGTFVYTCDIDALPGAGDIPADAVPGGDPDTLTNTVTVVATPANGGDPVTLTDTVSASVN